jgi:hypothetical protein
MERGLGGLGGLEQPPRLHPQKNADEATPQEGN